MRTFLVAIAMLVLVPAAAHAAPTVSAALYSPALSGTIDSATPDVSVTATLRRSAFQTSANTLDVATASTTTGANGSWTLTLPQHAIRPNDTLVLDYGTSGPPDVTIGPSSTGFFALGGTLIDSAGTTATVSCSACSAVSVTHGAQTDALTKQSLSSTFVGTLTPSVTAVTATTVTATVPQPDGSVLSLSRPGALPGAATSAQYFNETSPLCRVEAVAGRVECLGLTAGSYTLALRRNGATLRTAGFSVPQERSNFLPSTPTWPRASS